MEIVKELELTKTSSYTVIVKLDESINLEDLDEMELYELIIQYNVGGQDDFELECKDSDFHPQHILRLDESGHPDMRFNMRHPPDEPS